MEELGEKQQLAEEGSAGAAAVERFVGLLDDLQEEVRQAANNAAQIQTEFLEGQLAEGREGERLGVEEGALQQQAHFGAEHTRLQQEGAGDEKRVGFEIRRKFGE